VSGLAGRSLRLGSLPRRPDQDREAEEGETGGQEEVAHRCDRLDERERYRDEIAERPGMAEEVGVEGRRQKAVEGRQVGRREARGEQARLPDDHRPTVDDDRHPVGQDARESRPEPGLAAVHPDPREEDRVGPGEQRQAERLGERDPPVQRSFAGEPDDDRDEQQG
jgi:hypothetical protein